MDWVLLGIGSMLSSELLLRLPMNRSLHSLSTAAQKESSTIKSTRLSDHWKERVFPQYALWIFTDSLMSFLLLFITLVPARMILLVAEQTGVDVVDFAMSVRGLVFSTLVCILYLVIQRTVGRFNVQLPIKSSASVGSGQ